MTDVDLPNLTSIHSDGTSFMYPRNVTVESIIKCLLRITFRYSKSTEYQSSWCIPESSIEISFEYDLTALFYTQILALN